MSTAAFTLQFIGMDGAPRRLCSLSQNVSLICCFPSIIHRLDEGLSKTTDACFRMNSEDDLALTRMREQPIVASLGDTTVASTTDATTTRPLLASWILKNLKLLKESVPAERFHNGDCAKMVFEVMRVSNQGNLFGFVDGMCPDMIDRTVRYLDLHQEVANIFPWYKAPDSQQDQLLPIAQLLFQEILLPKPFPDHERRFDASSFHAFTTSCCVDEESKLLIERLHNTEILVSYLPLKTAVKHSLAPPKWGTIQEEIIRTSTSTQQPPEYVKVFVSHRWASETIPNLENDWKDLCTFLSGLITAALSTCYGLLLAGFPLAEALPLFNRKRDDLAQLKCIYQLDIPLPLGEWKPIVSASLGWSVALLSAQFLLHGWDPSETYQDVFHRCIPAISQRILLWYDWCCLPQKPRSTDEMQERFHQTLEELPTLQVSMHTLCITTSETYMTRAWCVSEWLHAQLQCSEWNRRFMGMQKNTQLFRYSMQLEVLRLLLDTVHYSHDVLEALDLQFTDEEHIKNEEFICWLFWSAVVKNSNLRFMGNGWSFDDENRILRVGLGRRKIVVPWLKLVAKEIECGATGCCRRKWQEIRDAVVSCALELGDSDGIVMVRTQVTRSYESNDFNIELRSRIRSAIEDAICKVYELGSDKTPFAIYLDFSVIFPPLPKEPITRSILTEIDPKLNDIIDDEILDEYNRNI